MIHLAIELWAIGKIIGFGFAVITIALWLVCTICEWILGGG